MTDATTQLRASDVWLRVLIEQCDIDPDATVMAVDAVTAQGKRTELASPSLSLCLAANAEALSAPVSEALRAIAAQKRLPTRAEAAAAAALLLRCNGADLSEWSDDLWPDDDATDALKTIAVRLG